MLHSLVIKFSFPPRNETLLDPANGFRRVGISMGRPSSLLRTSSLRPSFAIQSPARGPRLVNGVVVHIWRYPTAPKNSALGGKHNAPAHTGRPRSHSDIMESAHAFVSLATQRTRAWTSCISPNQRPAQTVADPARSKSH